MKIRVFLADDHAVVRDGLRLILEAQNDITVVGDAADGCQAVKEVMELKPDIVIIGIALPGLNGIEATQQIHESCPPTKVLILSRYFSTKDIFGALKAGALGYLLKESTGMEVVKAVQEIYLGHHYLSQKILETLINDYIQQQEALQRSNPLARLSGRERQILHLIAEGEKTKGIARILSLSPKSVETYRSRLTEKLGIDGVSSLVKFAIRNGLTSME